MYATLHRGAKLHRCNHTALASLLCSVHRPSARLRHHQPQPPNVTSNTSKAPASNSRPAAQQRLTGARRQGALAPTSPRALGLPLSHRIGSGHAILVAILVRKLPKLCTFWKHNLCRAPFVFLYSCLCTFSKKVFVCALFSKKTGAEHFSCKKIRGGALKQHSVTFSTHLSLSVTNSLQKCLCQTLSNYV